MTATLKTDVLQALAAWNAGKPVRSLELGRAPPMEEKENQPARVERNVRIDFVQHVCSAMIRASEWIDVVN